MNRRKLILGGACLIAAPAIVKAEWIMPVSTVRWATSPFTGKPIRWYRDGKTWVGYYKHYKIVREIWGSGEGFSFHPGIPEEDITKYYHVSGYTATLLRREILDG